MATKEKSMKPENQDDYKDEASIVEKDIDYVGNELVGLSDRINKMETLVQSISVKLKRISDRMGL